MTGSGGDEAPAAELLPASTASWGPGVDKRPNSLMRLADGGYVGYDGLIVATGVRPRRLPGRGGHVLRTLHDAVELRKRLGPGRAGAWPWSVRDFWPGTTRR
ncbi:hypothetical protein [Micromonospora sp. NBC_01796]|uniref:hypothetical protein n=1 Tax=Micromonospora sp. NBC_01796 TaxID=2975987 RepID=UPI002DDB251F|nr:hypothetical protein [Micromonospora sp. NBC_01796]WSA84005.1 hypothetical protein OIE47_27080 [Micromonospora sp. NBC_01796]